MPALYEEVMGHHAAQRRADAPYRREIQIDYQPHSWLNRRMSAGAIIGEPLAIEREERIAALFERVGLPAEFMADYPHESSGGQR